MFDIRWIRENPGAFDHGLELRGLPPRSEEIISLDRARRTAVSEAQAIQAERNRLSHEIGARKNRNENVQAILSQVTQIKEQQAKAEESAKRHELALQTLLAKLPNLPSAGVPSGSDERANVEVRQRGQSPQFPFQPRDHIEIGKALRMMDFDSAANMSGARFVVLKGALARLERALAAFMLDMHTEEFGYTEVNPPALVRDSALFGTGQLPKFGAELFRTTDGFWLIPTAEVPLTNLFANQILEENRLPSRVTAMTWCFRSEAGAAGQDTRGMIRQHQFTKVELVTITQASNSEAELERMTGCAEEVLFRLGLSYRVMALCTGDLGFSASKTYDLEVWLPGQERYREISSCSNCGEFQARRMRARYRAKGEKGTRFVHTLNGSGLAVGRTLVAVLENYQQEDGSVRVPDCLRQYMGGLEVIAPHA